MAHRDILDALIFKEIDYDTKGIGLSEVAHRGGLCHL